MCNLDQYTRADLEKMTKDDIIKLALQGITVETIISRDFDKKTGELINLKTRTIDAYSGAVIETREVKKTFYDSGEVDIISVKVTDKAGKAIQIDVKHDVTGKTPPVATTAAVIDEGTIPEDGNGGAAMASKSVMSTILDLFKQPEPEVEPEPVKEIETAEEPVIELETMAQPDLQPEPEPFVEVMPVIENETMTITGAPMVYVVEHPASQVVEMEPVAPTVSHILEPVEMSQVYFDEPPLQWTPAVTEVPKLWGIPVMSKTLWRWIKRS